MAIVYACTEPSFRKAERRPRRDRGGSIALGPAVHHLVVEGADSFLLLEAPAEVGGIGIADINRGAGYRVAVIEKFFGLIDPEVGEIIKGVVPVTSLKILLV